jgi:hypothetical protein
MKKIYLLFCLLTVLASEGFSQYEMDFGVNLGGANYLGEIGSNAAKAQPWLLDLKFGQTNFAVGAFFRYSFNRNLSAKINFNYARVQGADSTAESPEQRARNLSFRTEILEATLSGEYAFFVLNDLSRRSRQRIDFRAYAFAGAGVALYYPYAQYKDKWYYLRPLNTEGTENAYDEMTIAIPLGLGAAYTFNKKIRVGMEIGYRFTFTDYLDDVSTDFAYDSELPFEESKIFANRSEEAFLKGDPELPHPGFFVSGSRRGNPDTNDGYILAQFSISYVISNSNSFGRARYNSIINRRRKKTKF